VGGILLVGLFLAFIWRGYVIASRAPDTFSMLTAFGITTHVGLQAFLNMCVATDIIPNTGISLPFFSYGGSSLLVLLCEMGLLLSISRQYYRKKSDLEREQLLKELG
jgi:cell division protein FtsW